MKSFFITLFLLLCLFQSSSYAQDGMRPTFGWPVACTLDQDCWFMNYVDLDPAENSFKGPFCGPAGYDGHKGTDIAIASQKVMEQGIAVLAAHEGTIERIRDGEEDRFPTQDDMEAVKAARKECGNAVLIDHGAGIKTMYCHLKKGSLLVKPGDAVKRGQKIGEIGLSGFTEFPHLHFGIQWEGAIMDPFTGQANTQNCLESALRARPLWDPALDIRHTPISLYNAGFHNGKPDMSAINRGEQSVETLPQNQDALTFWATILNIQEGDRIAMDVIAPDGTLFAEQKSVQDKTRAQQFYFIGRRLSAPLLPGSYIGKAMITREINGKDKTFQIMRTLYVQPGTEN